MPFKVSFDAVIVVNLVKRVGKKVSLFLQLETNLSWLVKNSFYSTCGEGCVRKSSLTEWGIKSGCNGSVIVDIK